MANTDRRFAISVAGTPRELFSVGEIPNTDDRTKLDLNIHFRGGARQLVRASLAELLQTTNAAEYAPGNNHISIHANARSLETNTIKMTITREGGANLEQVHLTTGIKKHNRFVPVLFRVCGDLRRERFELPACTDAEIVKIGEYDPATAQFRFMVIACSPEKSFCFEPEHPSNFRQFRFHDFGLVLLWSYFGKPSHPQAINMFLPTLREIGPHEGLEHWQVYNLYTELNATHAMQYFASFGDTVGK